MPPEGVAETRPALSRKLSATEFLRWYWLKAELFEFARSLGISPGGSKDAITNRIAAFLDGKDLPRPETLRKNGATQLAEPLTRSTLIPAGQRSSQVLRRFFEREIGPGFRFDSAMRTFLEEGRGDQTLGDAITFYQTQRPKEPNPIGAQFELNRFTRTFYEQHPTGTAGELKAAWMKYRSLPVDRRGRA